MKEKGTDGDPSHQPSLDRFFFESDERAIEPSRYKVLGISYSVGATASGGSSPWWSHTTQYRQIPLPSLFSIFSPSNYVIIGLGRHGSGSVGIQVETLLSGSEVRMGSVQAGLSRLGITMAPLGQSQVCQVFPQNAPHPGGIWSQDVA